MLYPIGPNGVINQGYADFHKKVQMTMVHVPQFSIKHQKFPKILSFLDLEPRDANTCHLRCFSEICIPSVYKVSRFYQVLS